MPKIVKTINIIFLSKVYKDIHVILAEKEVDDPSQLDVTDQSALCECEAGCTELRYSRYHNILNL